MINKKKKTILVTGGAGFIGTHTALALKNKGYEIIVLDNLIYGHRELVEDILKVKLIVGDISDRQLLDNIFANYSIDVVMHFAAYIDVGESVTNPVKYYQNNVVGTLILLEAMVKANIKKFVFSSTCATYGIPQYLPLTEDHPQFPINPYGKTKLMVEQIIKDFDIAYNLKSVIFRYFNAAGAHPNGLLGEDHDPETHLISIILLTALGKRDSIKIFGTDYDTPDGTCIRDYIHVCDLAQAHILGLEYLLEGGDTQAFNLGNGNGFSVKEVIETAKKVTQKHIEVIESSRREGDPPILIGSSKKAIEILNWKPQYPEISQIIKHAWQWHQNRHC